MQITGDQLRAARHLARMEQSQLAEAANVTVRTLRRYEHQTLVSTEHKTVVLLVTALEAAGVRFLSLGDVVEGAFGIVLAHAPSLSDHHAGSPP